MCPMCMTSAAVLAASTASGAGLMTFLALKLRALRSRRNTSAEPHATHHM